MMVSSNEVQMLVLKACRGVGVPMGQAREVAVALAQTPQALAALLPHLARPMQPAKFDFSDGLTVQDLSLLPLCRLPTRRWGAVRGRAST